MYNVTLELVSDDDSCEANRIIILVGLVGIYFNNISILHDNSICALFRAIIRHYLQKTTALCV